MFENGSPGCSAKTKRAPSAPTPVPRRQSLRIASVSRGPLSTRAPKTRKSFPAPLIFVIRSEDEEGSIRADPRATAAEPADRLGLPRASLDARPEDQEVVSCSTHLRERTRQRAER